MKRNRNPMQIARALKGDHPFKLNRRDRRTLENTGKSAKVLAARQQLKAKA
jgi:hypothetical protein